MVLPSTNRGRRSRLELEARSEEKRFEVDR